MLTFFRMVRTKVSHSLLWIVVIVLSIHGYHSFQPQLIRDFARQQVPIYVRSNVEQAAPPAPANWPQNQEAPRANEQFSLEIFSVSNLAFILGNYAER